MITEAIDELTGMVILIQAERVKTYVADQIALDPENRDMPLKNLILIAERVSR